MRETPLQRAKQNEWGPRMESVSSRSTLLVNFFSRRSCTPWTLSSSIPHIQSHSGDQSSTSARKLTHEEAFSQVLIGAETVLSDKLHNSEPNMKAIDRSLNLILEVGLVKRVARTKTRVMDGRGKTLLLLGSLLQETAGRVVSKSYFSPHFTPRYSSVSGLKCLI